MPYRVTPLVNGEYYHIFNRGVALLPTYLSKKDYQRFLLCLQYYRFQDLSAKLSKILQLPTEDRNKILSGLEIENRKEVELIAFCLMPNHFHLLVRQEADNGISTFMKKITDSYTRYFNTKHQRAGPIFQGAFKAVRVETNEQLLHLSRYIHLNPLVSYTVREQDFLTYLWSSLSCYLTGKTGLIDSKPILENFKNQQAYLQFIQDQADYGKELERIKHLTFE